MKSDKPETAGGEARSDAKAGRLGGARADFVSTLGRRAADVRNVLATLEREPEARGPRDELRRKLHALGAGARLLRFDAMGTALATAEALLDRVAEAGKATAEDLDRLARVLDDLPGLAWSDPERRPTGEQAAKIEVTPFTALVIGEQEIATALAEVPDAPDAARFACEHTTDAQVAFGRARSIVPDVIVLDGDLDGAAELTEALLDEASTEQIPIVVLGRFAKPDEAARFVALGVSRTLSKPVAAEHLHFTCEELVDERTSKTMRIALGEPTVEQLGERLADEVRRALVDAVDEALRGSRVPLGQGAEVLGAVWGAIARVREVVTTRTGGTVRFTSQGPEGAIALAPWLHADSAGAERALARGRGAAADVRLEGRRVVVADDDPAVTWFIADLLRSTGCVVHEALDGQSALELCYQISPDLVVTDILMPKLDGFGLLRTLKRDVALRDTPVILLSWKEDLLQRVRELGASAAAYLRKESDARAIVARVREALWSRARLERRLSSDAEVRGRLDGVSVRTLLELTCQARPNSRISLRDAACHYEIEIRGGSPRRATRSGASESDFASGDAAFAAALGIGAARFVVGPSEGAIPHDFSGSLRDLLERPVARARAAARVLCGAQAAKVAKVELDERALQGYLRTTPEPACGLVERIAAGGSPRTMLGGGEVDPILLDEVLADLAARGLVLGVYAEGGEDLLAGSFDDSLSLMKGAPKVLPAPSRSNRPAAVRPAPAATPVPPPASLADAVMQELRERSSNPPPIVEPASLKLRPSSSFPPSPPPAVVEKHGRTEVDAVYTLDRLTPSGPAVPRAEALPEIEAAAEIPREPLDLEVVPGDHEADAAAAAADEHEEMVPESDEPPQVDLALAAHEESPRTPMTSVATKTTAREKLEAPRSGSSTKKWMLAIGAVGIAAFGLAAFEGVIPLEWSGATTAAAGPSEPTTDLAAAPAAEPPAPVTITGAEVPAAPADAGHTTKTSNDGKTSGDAATPHVP